jgi:hypothetical protein
MSQQSFTRATPPPTFPRNRVLSTLVLALGQFAAGFCCLGGACVVILWLLMDKDFARELYVYIVGGVPAVLSFCLGPALFIAFRRTWWLTEEAEDLRVKAWELQLQVEALRRRLPTGPSDPS